MQRVPATGDSNFLESKQRAESARRGGRPGTVRRIQRALFKETTDDTITDEQPATIRTRLPGYHGRNDIVTDIYLRNNGGQAVKMCPCPCVCVCVCDAFLNPFGATGVRLCTQFCPVWKYLWNVNINLCCCIFTLTDFNGCKTTRLSRSHGKRCRNWT